MDKYLTSTPHIYMYMKGTYYYHFYTAPFP